MLGCASEIMTSQVISIKEDDNLETAIKILSDNNISGLPVIDKNNKLVGIISESDIIAYSGKIQVVSKISAKGWVSPYTEVSDMASFKKGLDLLAKTKVNVVMNKKVVTVKTTDCGIDIITLIGKKNINRVPVTDQNGILVGIITRSDIIKNLAHRNCTQFE